MRGNTHEGSNPSSSAMAKGKAVSANRKKKRGDYRKNKTREKNKIKKLLKYLKVHPNNMVAIKRLTELQSLVH